MTNQFADFVFSESRCSRPRVNLMVLGDGYIKLKSIRPGQPHITVLVFSRSDIGTAIAPFEA